MDFKAELSLSPEVKALFENARTLKAQDATVDMSIRLDPGMGKVVLYLLAPHGGFIKGIEKIFPSVLASKFSLSDVTEVILNDVPYIRRLEYGWSKQAPSGFLRNYLPEYGTIAKREIEKAASANPGDPRAAIKAGLQAAAKVIAETIRTRTPIDTGRARAAWKVEEG